MQATGFFYECNGITYLLTARHNVLPTNSKLFNDGIARVNFTTELELPTVDIYLRADDEFESKRYDVRDVNGVKQTREIDVIGIPIDFDPTDYGYVVWNKTDLGQPEKSKETVKSVGFGYKSFPEGLSLTDEAYSQSIDGPVQLSMDNTMLKDHHAEKTGLMAVGTDLDFVGADSDYNGFSGSPIIGDGLVGIHGSNATVPDVPINSYDQEVVAIHYWRAAVLPELLD